MACHELIRSWDRCSEHERPTAEPPIIGRGEGCAVELRDALDSKHARVVCAEDGHILEDTGSRHGTTLNGKPVLRARLSCGDEIGPSETVLRYEEILLG
jgi:pSer/pThr/pTyr-binding forkhead associated (FHA) protein